ncbi:MAG TPA: DUF3617 family protein [Alphaproteobacteria bacterium]|nr:DUF3617 family protein [Alphaproteobacteria bacterium]
MKIVVPLSAALSIAVLLSLPAAAAGDLREMLKQPGEWEATIRGSLIPPQAQKGCYGGNKSVADLTTKSFKNCSQQSVNISAGSATVDAVCQFQSLKVTVHGTITPVGDDALHSDSQVQVEGLPQIQGLSSAMNVTMDAKRIGPCKPGEKPM